LHFAAQKANGEMRKVRGDEMRAYDTRIVSGTGGGDCSSLMSLLFNDTTAATFTFNNGSAVEGHSVRAQAMAIEVGTPHKLLLPTGVFWGTSGSNRAALIAATTDRLDAVCHNISGTLYFVPQIETGISYAAS
jgi:hypothetical protein